MEQLVYPNPAAYREKLIRFSQLNHTMYSEVGDSLTYAYLSIQRDFKLYATVDCGS